jgi:hypothetical protein
MPTDIYHTCEQGPLCEQLSRYLDVMGGYAEDPISRASGYYPDPPADVTECEHRTCHAIVYAPCEACTIEALSETMNPWKDTPGRNPS